MAQYSIITYQKYCELNEQFMDLSFYTPGDDIFLKKYQFFCDAIFSVARTHCDSTLLSSIESYVTEVDLQRIILLLTMLEAEDINHDNITFHAPTDFVFIVPGSSNAMSTAMSVHNLLEDNSIPCIAYKDVKAVGGIGSNFHIVCKDVVARLNCPYPHYGGLVAFDVWYKMCAIRSINFPSAMTNFIDFITFQFYEASDCPFSGRTKPLEPRVKRLWDKLVHSKASLDYVSRALTFNLEEDSIRKAHNEEDWWF